MAFKPEALMVGDVVGETILYSLNGVAGLCVQIMLRDGFKPVLRDVDG